jgi:glucose-1-phosphate thymidylyltransferase
VGEIVGVIPAAGYATRLQPLTGSKEVVAVRGRPVIEHLVERMRRGGSTRLRVVTRPEKQDVIDICGRMDAEAVLANPPTVAASIAAGLDGLAPADVVLIGFPDTLWEPVDGYRRLVDGVHAGAEVALGLFCVHASDLSRSDVVLTDGLRVRAVDVKPARPRSSLVWGCAAARVRALDGLELSEWPGTHFDRLCRSSIEVRGYAMSDRWLDIGTRSALKVAKD